MKEITTKCLLYVLSFALLLTGLSTVFSSSAFAASNSQATTPTLKIGSEVCSNETDITLNNTSLISLVDDTSPFHYSKLSASSSIKQQVSQFANEWHQRIQSSTTGWGVAQTAGLDLYGQQSWIVSYILQNNPSETLRVEGNDLISDDGYKALSIAVNPNNCHLVLASMYEFQYNNQPIQTYNNHGLISNVTRLLYMNAPINYDASWTGPPIPSSIDAPNTDLDVRPSGAYSVIDRSLNLKNALTLRQSIKNVYPNYPEPYFVPTGYFTYYLYKCSGDDCSDLIKTDTNLIETSDYNYEFQDHGDYLLSYGYTFPSVVPKPQSPDGHTLTYPPQSFKLRIDGSSYSSSSNSEQCQNGYCQPPPLYEDCLNKGFDLLAGFQCVIKNFGTFMKLTLVTLFVPNSKFMSDRFNSMKASVTDGLGFLYSPIEIISDLYKFVTNSTINPTGDTCALPQFSVFGSPATSIEVCKWRYQIPQLWQLMQTILQGSLSLSFIFVAYRLLNQLFGRNVDDDDDEWSMSETQTYNARTGRESSHTISRRRKL